MQLLIKLTLFPKMPPKPELIRTLEQADNKIVRRFKEQANSDFKEHFEDKLAETLWYLTNHLPSIPPIQTIEREGVVGYRPPPAKRINAIEALMGQPTSPLRVYDEEIQKGKPERIMETTTFHLVLEASPLAVANKSELAAVANTLKVLSSKIGNRGFVIELPEDKPNLRAKKAQAIVHLVRRDILGNYQYQQLTISEPGDINKAILAYQQASYDSLVAHPFGEPNGDYLAHGILGRKIAEAIKKDQGYDRITIPIEVAPKAYRDYGISTVAKFAPVAFGQNLFLRVARNGEVKSLAYAPSSEEVEEINGSEK